MCWKAWVVAAEVTALSSWSDMLLDSRYARWRAGAAGGAGQEPQPSAVPASGAGTEADNDVLPAAALTPLPQDCALRPYPGHNLQE